MRKQQNAGQDRVKDQEVDGQWEVEIDRPGQEVEKVIDAVHPKEIPRVHLCWRQTDTKVDHPNNKWISSYFLL